jgi:phage terminase large subunit-like protein
VKGRRRGRQAPAVDVPLPAGEVAPAPGTDSLSYAARAERYARAVIEGRVLAGKFVKAACQRHLDDLERSATDPAWPWRFDADIAGRPCAFLELLPHVKGEWARPVVRDGFLHVPHLVLEDWQVFFVAVLFGWVHRVTGLRRFRRAYLEVARKNAKSTMLAGIALYMTAADREPGAEVYCTATKKDQAKIVWDISRQMVQRERDFSSLGVGYNTRAIFHDPSGSKCEPLGRDSDSIDGLNTHCFISDELHAQKDRGLYDVLDSSTGARSQPLGIGITTAGDDETGVCFEQRGYLVRILNRTLLAHDGMGYKVHGGEHQDDRYFGVIYTLDKGYADDRPDDDWGDEQFWGKANPNLGISVYVDDMRAKAEKARVSVMSQPEFRKKHCNEWLTTASPWMDLAKWDKCADAPPVEDFAGRPCHEGLDAAFKTDIFAKMKVFERDGHYYAYGEYWVPVAVAEHKENAEIWSFVEQKLINAVPGAVVEIEPVRDSIKRDRELFDLREVGYDPAMLTQFATEMLNDGYPMVEIAPTFNRFSEPMKKISELVLQRRFHHTGDPVLRWMIGNVLCVEKRGLIFPSKQKGQERKRKIDGAIALIIAMGRAIVSGGVSMPEDHVPTAA